MNLYNLGYYSTFAAAGDSDVDNSAAFELQLPGFHAFVASSAVSFYFSQLLI